MYWTSISHAHDYWLRTRLVADPPAKAEEAEVFILLTQPSTHQDAACILDVVRGYGGDSRCDGLDYAALGRVWLYLTGGRETSIA